MKNIIENKIHNYDNVTFFSKPSKFADVITDKYNKVHKLLFNAALNNYINKHPSISKETHTFIEIKQRDYWMPSSVIIIDKVNVPHTKIKVDLTPYWNNYQYNKNNSDFSILYISDETKAYSEIIYIDYVKQKTQLRYKLTGYTYWVDNSLITNDIPYAEDFSRMEKTFTNLFRKQQ